MEFDTLLAEKRTITVNVGPGEVPIMYYAGKFSGEFDQRLSEISSEEALVELLAGWGFTRGDDPVPLNLETVNKLPGFAKLAIWKAIQEDQRPNLRASASTNSGS